MSKLSDSLSLVNGFLSFHRYQLVVQPFDRGIYVMIETIRANTKLFEATGPTLDRALINLAEIIETR